MEPVTFTKRIIDFNRTCFDNSYNTVAAMQNHGENVLHGILQQLPWITEESVRPFADSVSFGKKLREEYKQNIDQLFNGLTELVGTSQTKPEEKVQTEVNVSAGPADKKTLTPVAQKTKQAIKG